MDTQYSNIVNALGAMRGGKDALTPQQKTDNYNAFTKLMDQGVYIPDLVKRLDTLETEIKNLKSEPKNAPLDADLFAVMESAVKDDADVKLARNKMQEEKTRVLMDLCCADEKFKGALDDYRRTVNKAYIRQKEQTQN